MKNLHLLDKLDLEFLMGIQDELETFFGSKSSEILLNSSFLERLQETPEYVYHYDEHYWAQVIQREFSANNPQHLVCN